MNLHPVAPRTAWNHSHAVVRALAGAAVAVFAALALAPRAARAAETKAFVLTSDFSTGSMSVMDLATRAVTRDVASVYSDAVIRTYGGLIYVVNRFGQDNIQVIDPASAYGTVRQFSTGAGTNPQDIAFVSPTKAYVTLYERSAIQICNPATGALLDTISLAQFADADHLPEMARMTIVGTHLFVAIQRLNRLAGYVASGPGLVAVIDTQTDALIDVDPVTAGTQAIQLSGGEPGHGFHSRAGNGSAVDRMRGRVRRAGRRDRCVRHIDAARGGHGLERGAARW